MDVKHHETPCRPPTLRGRFNRTIMSWLGCATVVAAVLVKSSPLLSREVPSTRRDRRLPPEWLCIKTANRASHFNVLVINGWDKVARLVNEPQPWKRKEIQSKLTRTKVRLLTSLVGALSLGQPGFSPRCSHGCLYTGWLKCCFTSTETVGILGTGAQDVHLDFHTAPELWVTHWMVRLIACMHSV